MTYRAPVLVSLAALSLVAMAPAASAVDIFGRGPSVEITVPHVISEAQLGRQLRSQGFTGIQLSPLRPTPADPQPEAAADDFNLEQEPVHEGWNGTASKGGLVYRVRVSYGSAPSVVEDRG